MNAALFEKKFNQLKARPKANLSGIEVIQQWLLNCHEIERMRIHPYDIIHQTALDLAVIIPEMLHGVAIGLFDLYWDIRCPHCNMVTNDYQKLSKLTATSNCPMCEKLFEVDFEQLVEVTFSLNNNIEYIESAPPCSPPPSIGARFVIGLHYQQTGSAEDVLEVGVYRYFCPVTRAEGTLTVAGAQSEHLQEFNLIQLMGPHFDIEELAARPGKIKLNLVNQGHPLCGLYVIPKGDLPLLKPEDIPIRLSGLDIVHYPDYWALFSNQVLSNRERLKISFITVMFTDIIGSTQMYEKLGDPIAYNIVRDHFDILFKVIEKHNGITLKTIGDAVMATFINNEQAIESILAAFTEFEQYNQNRNLDEQIYIKVGIHRGSAILVTLNNHLDYFGSTINKAVRIQDQAGSNEITFSSQVYEDDAFQRALERLGIKQVHKKIVDLKGIDNRQVIHKIIYG